MSDDGQESDRYLIRFYTSCMRLKAKITQRNHDIEAAAREWSEQEKNRWFDQNPIHPGGVILELYQKQPEYVGDLIMWGLRIKRSEVIEFLGGQIDMTDSLCALFSEHLKMPESFWLNVQQCYNQSQGVTVTEDERTNTAPQLVSRRSKNFYKRYDGVLITALGQEQKALAEWADDPRCMVNLQTLTKRIQRGWEADRAITQPARKKRPDRSKANGEAEDESEEVLP